MNKFTFLFSTLPLALGGLCGCRSAANPLQAERTPTTTPVVRRLAGETTAENTSVVRVVNLGSFQYTTPNENGWIRATDELAYAIAPSDNNTLPSIVCGAFTTATPNGTWTTDGTITIMTTGAIAIRDASFLSLSAEQVKSQLAGVYAYYKATGGNSAETNLINQGYTAGYDQGRSQGYTEGYDTGVAQATGELVLNETYTGLYAFYNQYYLSHWAYDIEAGVITTLDHFFIKFSAENYELDLYFYQMDGEGDTFSGAYEIFAFVEANGTTMSDMAKVGQLSGYAIADDDYSSSWIYQFNPTTFSFTTIKQSANEVAPINFGRQMTLHHYANLNGAKNFIIGKGNQYAEGYNAGQQDTIEATEAFNNVFTIFGKAFSAVSSFLNLSIGPFKMWYFFLMPIIVALFILVLRLVKH